MRKQGSCNSCGIELLHRVFLVGIAFAADKDLTEMVLEGCKKEFETYCKNVTPGEGRLRACLYAYEDNLSARCEHSLYDASAQLERAITALTYVTNECRGDLKAHCSAVEPGKAGCSPVLTSRKERSANAVTRR